MNTFRISFWTLNLLSFIVCWINCRQASEKEIIFSTTAIHGSSFTHQGPEHAEVTDSIDSLDPPWLPPKSKK